MPFSFKREEDSLQPKKPKNERISKPETKDGKDSPKTKPGKQILEIARQYRNWKVDDEKGSITSVSAF